MSEEDRERYTRAAHAMQTGVAFSKNTKEQEPKQLRVGVNAAMSAQGGLAELLIAKGVITRDEYEKAVADAMEAEAEAYRKRLQAEYGTENITTITLS